eukprot:scaffold118301_cov60-Phaeocystis_antarctica.AAC.1
MANMFEVCSARATISAVGFCSPCTLLAPPPPHALSSPGPAFRDGVQPDAEFRHVQRHTNDADVSCALYALHPASRLAPRLALCGPLSTRQDAYAFNQPLSLSTSKVTHMWAMFYVRRRGPPP